jgi:uncharacterized protein
MPATDSAMGPPMGSDSSSGAPGGGMANKMASPAILGLLAFGMTAILFGLSQLPKPYGNGFVGFAGVQDTELILGGLVLILVGLIALWRGHLFWGTAFFGYGAFWASWAAVTTLTPGYATAAVAFIWLMFTLTFLISSFKHGWVTFFFLLFLFIGFILLVIEFWQWGSGGLTTKISSGESWAIGAIWIIAGFIAWYNGTAQLTEHTYGKKILPG